MSDAFGELSALHVVAGENKPIPEGIVNGRHRPIMPKRETSAPSQTSAPPVLHPESVILEPLDWLRRFLAANPFYLASLALLLYGIHRVSSDTGFLRVEVQQLFFNFTALQLYEIALVGLALFLAKRLVWYDSTLLVLLENVVLIVPILLVTQASLIDQSWIWGFWACGLTLVLVRVGLLKRFLRELNLPWRMLALGGVLLLVNGVLPVVYRELQEERMGKNITWGPAYEVNEWSWLVLLPMLVLTANLLPAPRATGPLWPQQRWLPYAVFGTWLLASGVHLYALSYVYTFQMRAAHWAPMLVALGWTAHRLLPGFVENRFARLQAVLLAAPFPLALLALASNDRGVAGALLVINVGLYVWTALHSRRPLLPVQLSLASGVAAITCLPANWTFDLVDPLPTGSGFMVLLMGYLFLSSLLARQPAMGLVGALTTGVGLVALMPAMPQPLYCAFHAALLFLTLHSLRWEDEAQVAVRAARWIVAACWTGNAVLWSIAGGPVGQLTGIGLGVLTVWFLLLWMGGVRPPVAVAVGGAAVTLAVPLVNAGQWMLKAPPGPLAVVASFVLLGVGTLVALTKHHWHPVAED